MAEESPNFLLGFFFSVLAGFSTCFGVLFIPLINSKLVSEEKSMAAAMAFAAGVMLWLGFMGILAGEALEFFDSHYSEHGHSHGGGHHENELEVRLFLAGFFFIGMAVTVGVEQLVDRCFGAHGHGHGHGHAHGHGHSISHHGDHGQELIESKTAELLAKDAEMLAAAGVAPPVAPQVAPQDIQTPAENGANDRLFKVTIVAILALFVHSFPEGLATFFTSAEGNFLIAFGIALHHIPGGAAIAMATYKSTGGSYLNALKATAFAGVALPLGAAVGWLMVIILDIERITDFAYGAMFAGSGGTLVAIALSGMLPEALTQSSSTFVLFWATIGFVVMEGSIIILVASGGHSH